MGNRGGKREGAGRPKGATTRKAREIADRAAAEGITPLEVRLHLMNHYWAKAVDADGKIVDEAMAEKAAAISEPAMRYIHPALAAVEHSGPEGGPIVHRLTNARDAVTRKLAGLLTER